MCPCSHGESPGSSCPHSQGPSVSSQQHPGHHALPVCVPQPVSAFTDLRLALASGQLELILDQHCHRCFIHMGQVQKLQGLQGGLANEVTIHVCG